MFCVYCGMNEMDICSPFVIGQTREEHDIYVKGFKNPVANGVLPGLKNSKVCFQIDGFVEGPPSVEVPYFPLLSDENGKELCQEIRSLGKEPLIVHEMCALQMFQARLDRSRHTLRRRRKLIGDQVIATAGFNTIALGCDSTGRSYWKFPINDDLFVCLRKPVVQEKQEFNMKFGRTNSTPNSSDHIDPSTSVWKRISDTGVIRNLVALLAKEESSHSLRQNIINYLLTKREVKVSQVVINAQAKNASDNEDMMSNADNDASTAGDDHVDEKSDDDKVKPDTRRESARNSQTLDSTPCALKLLKDKGFDILPLYEIAEEAVFEDVNAIVDEEDDGLSHREYFSYSRK
jgi:hypothetical protein